MSSPSADVALLRRTDAMDTLIEAVFIALGHDAL